MYTDSQFTKHIFFLIGDHPYTWAKEKGIKKSVIGQLKRGRIPGLKILNQLANALGEDVNYLLSGEKPLGNAVVEHLTGYDGPEGQKGSNNLTREGKGVRMEDIKKRLKNRIDEITEDEQLKTLQRIVDGWEFENIKRRTEEDKKIHPETQKKNNTA